MSSRLCFTPRLWAPLLLLPLTAAYGQTPGAGGPGGLNTITVTGSGTTYTIAVSGMTKTGFAVDSLYCRPYLRNAARTLVGLKR